MSSRDSTIPHYSAFRPVSGIATSSSSKFMDKPITAGIYSQNEQEKVSPQQSASEGDCSNILKNKVRNFILF